MRKYVAAVAAFAALCGMVSVPANAVETTQPIREDVTPHVLVAIAAPESEPEPEPAGDPEPVDIDALANAVIHGDYGVGEERRAALGDNYNAVQARVNELVPVVVPEPEPVQVTPVAPVKPAAPASDDIPACINEDGSGQAGMCVWDAQTMGNHQGSGVFVYRDGVLIEQH